MRRRPNLGIVRPTAVRCDCGDRLGGDRDSTGMASQAPIGQTGWSADLEIRQ